MLTDMAGGELGDAGLHWHEIRQMPHGVICNDTPEGTVETLFQVFERNPDMPAMLVYVVEGYGMAYALGQKGTKPIGVGNGPRQPGELTDSVVALVVVFLLATVLPLNMGALALAATFFVGVLGLGLTTKEIFAGFPGDLFVTLVGVTYLFAIAQKNGTVDWLVERAVRLVRGHVAAIPWVMFLIAAALSGALL